MTLDQRDARLLEEVYRRIGVPTDEDAAHVVDAVADALGELLTPDEARLIGPYVSDRLARLIAKGTERHSDPGGLEQFVEGVSWRENVDHTVAMKHAKAVCDAIVALLPMDVQIKLRDDLPEDVVGFFQRKLDDEDDDLPRQRATRRRSAATP